jgi:KDO2-lipid IV(A) lauroyltransferase
VARLVGAAIRLFGVLPLPALLALGAAAGAAGYWLPTRERRVTDANLRLAYPDLDARARRRLARRSLRETGKTFAEFAAVWTWGRERLLRQIAEVSGEDLAREALARGGGVIVAGPHLGNWELAGAYCSLHHAITSLYQKPRIVELEPLSRRYRERFGARLVPAGVSAVRALLASLHRGEMVGILPDQDAGTGLGVFAPFFGQPANTMMLLPRLAAHTDALVVVTYAERLRDGRFHMRFVPASAGIGDSDVERAAAVLNADVERAVRATPEQYLWSYKRFRIRPPGFPDPYA